MNKIDGMNTFFEGMKRTNLNQLKPLRIILLTGLLFLGGIAAKARDYVITYTTGGTTYYLGMNGNSLASKTTFDPTCVWTCYNGNTEANLANNTSYSLRNKNNSSAYLTTSCTRSGNWNNYTYTWAGLTVQNSASNLWRSSDGGNGNVYAYYAEGTGWNAWNRYASIHVNTLTMQDNNNTDSKNYQVTVTTVNGISTDPVITSGNDVLTTITDYTYTASAAAFQVGFTNYRFNNVDHYFDENGNSITFTGNSSAANISYGWSLSPTQQGVAVSGNSTTGTVTVSALPENDVTLTLTVTATATGGNPAAPAGTTLTGTKTITIQGTYPSAPIITVSGTSVTLSTNATGTTSIRYTLDGTDPTATTGTVYNGTPIDLSGSTTSPVTIKAVTVRNGNASNVVEQSVMMTLPEPVITTNPEAGTATISCSITGTTIYYTLDGSEPTTSSSQYSGNLTGLNLMTTIKAIAVKEGWNNSTVASSTLTLPSGVSSDGVVTLFDYEDHSWSYYSDGNQPIHSLNPADVKISYFGNGTGTVTNASENGVTPTSFSLDATTVAVSGYEPANQFVYYKTLENDNAEGNGSNYSYTLIPNPFSKRPTVGNISTTAGATCWRGFYGWRVKSLSSGLSIQVGTTTYTSQNINAASIIPAEREITFVTTNEYGNEVQFEAMWAQAWFATAVNNTNNLNANVTYERNFIRVAGAINTTNSRPATIMELYPNGTTNGTTVATAAPNTARDLTGYALSADTKFEFIALRGTNVTMTANNHYLCFGRGISTANIAAGRVQGIPDPNNNPQNISNSFDYTIRMESGTYKQLAFVHSEGILNVNNGSWDENWRRININNTLHVNGIMGCDYDRALNDDDKLDVSGSRSLFFSQTVDLSDVNRGRRIFDLVVKSGNYQRNYQNDPAVYGQHTESFYCGPNNGSSGTSGSRYVTVEGGKFCSINGGTGGDDTDYDRIVYTLRMKGGTVERSLYGSGANSENFASRKIIVTGGTVRGWIAGGANGTNTTWGASVGTGNSHIYVGGNAVVGGSNPSVLNGTEGGNIFGAGRGNANQAASMLNSEVVVADNADILRNVYGGGNYGYIPGESNVYVLGGTVHEKVFGGAYGNVSGNGYNYDIPVSNVYVRGGVITEGVYGGSNWKGNVGNVTMHIDGGTVGSGEHGHGVFGGGLGDETRVTGNVSVSLGTCDATTGATVFGDVYGGSAKGVVNTNNNNTTTVSLYKGTIYGGLYGGGYGPGGEDADVNGKVYVKVYGGSVLCSAADPDGEAGTGSVFGCNNISGTPKSTVNVDIYSTDQPASGYALHAVYGGGNKAAYDQVPVVTVHGCNNSIEYVYGGGNATDVRGTDVTIWGGTIGNAFGGGNGFSETNNHTDEGAPHYNPGADITDEGTKLKIYGGEIGAVFGGSNQFGRINSTINVTVDTKKEPGSDPCSGVDYEECNLVIDELYGGGNEAPIQTSGNQWIVPTVQVLACDAYIKNYFGGARKADYGGNIEINIIAGRFDNVFGGNNKGGIIEGNVTLNLKGGTIGNAFGGCNEDGNIKGHITVNVIDVEDSCPLYVTNIYGGSNLTDYIPTYTPVAPETTDRISPLVNVIHARHGVSGNVYGGSKGKEGVTGEDVTKVDANPLVNIGYDENDDFMNVIPSDYPTTSTLTDWPKAFVAGSVFGGGDAAKVDGYTKIFIRNRAKVFGNIYGGGNMGEVTGNTQVIVNGFNN